MKWLAWVADIWVSAGCELVGVLPWFRFKHVMYSAGVRCPPRWWLVSRRWLLILGGIEEYFGK